MTLIEDLARSYSDQLETLYPKEEARSLTFWLFEYFFGMGRRDMNNGKAIDKIPDDLQDAFQQLLKGKPIQYVIGKAPFYGREFWVTPDVLIPRNETEELVHLIIKQNRAKEKCRVLDIGTGSGCIPISLALETDDWDILAVDISEKALTVARKNAEILSAKVGFQRCDILQDEIPPGPWDMVVSNPPYVRDSEKVHMHPNVLDHEPHLALFVDDKDPLVFYRTIAIKAWTVLNPGGKVYFEINEAFGQQTKIMLEAVGYVKTDLLKDLNGKDRMVVGQK